MTPERIAELRALAEQATPGPWQAIHGEGDKQGWISAPDATVCDMWTPNATADFIAAARTALPEALDAIERVRALQVKWADWDDPTLASELLAALEGKSDG
jgi:hypothetical protein